MGNFSPGAVEANVLNQRGRMVKNWVLEPTRQPGNFCILIAGYPVPVSDDIGHCFLGKEKRLAAKYRI